MKFEIEVEEKIVRTNRYIVEVGSEEEGNNILDGISKKIDYAIHPDDVVDAITSFGYEVQEIKYGAEEPAYEIV